VQTINGLLRPRFELAADGTGAFSVPMESERGSSLLFDAFSSREPVPTSLENALSAPPPHRKASKPLNRKGRREAGLFEMIGFRRDQ
jgi:hypothetical protein